MWSIAKRFVFNKIKQNLGLDQCNCFIFSAAPMRESTRSFFMNLNFFLINCYGMSELSGPQTFTNPNAWDSFATQEYFREAGQSLDGL
jgi:long-subunit acyl-CoA synthetase (AMP-forming)